MRQALFEESDVLDPNKIKYNNEKVSSKEDHLEEHDGECKPEQESDNNEESLPTTPKRQFRFDDIKMFALANAKMFYTANFEVYVGLQLLDPYCTNNSPADIVQRLCQPIAQSGRNITTDN
ncbi:hypothetical protein ILUMI_14121, partial [Ignelater luminosus]